MKETYESMKLLLGKIKYDKFKWKLCGDLRVVEKNSKASKAKMAIWHMHIACWIPNATNTH
jgi:hypothetical protein